MTTYLVEIAYSRVHHEDCLGRAEVEGRTKADAILAAQKEAARRWGLSRSDESFVKVEFL